MKTIISQQLKTTKEGQVKFFKSIFIRGISDGNNGIIDGAMKPRFVHLYSENIEKITEAIFLLDKILADSFVFDISQGSFDLPDESEQVDLLFHERSRVIDASDFCNVFKKSTKEDCISMLLKSTILLTINKFEPMGILTPPVYTCELNLRPTIAKITGDQKRMAFGSPYVALEITVRNDEYESIVDKYFDSVVIVNGDEVTECIAPEKIDELLNIAKKVVLGEHYKDELVTANEESI
jgi:hypothetical protein